MLMDADEFPLPYEYRFFDLDGLQSVPPQDLDERTVIFLDCGNIDRNPLEVVKRAGTHIINIDHHHDNTRFGTIDHVVVGRLVHRGDRVGPHGRPRRRADARGGRGALRRARDRHGQVHVREHRRARAPHGGRAHRGRRRRARHLPAPVRGHALRQARAARPRAGEPPARRRRRADVLAAVARRLPPGRRRGELLGGHHRPPALRGVDEGRRAGARAGQRGGQRPQEGLPARHGRQRRRLAHRARRRAAAGTARRPASPRASATTSSWPSCASRSPPSCRPAARRHRPAARTARPEPPSCAVRWTAWSSPTSPRARRRTTSSSLVRRGLGERRAGHAGTLDPFATGLLLVLVGRAAAHPALPHGAAEDLRGGRALRRGLDDGRPGGRDHDHGRGAGGAAPAADGPAAPAPARLQRRPRRRPSRLRSARGPGRRSSSPSARSSCTASRSSGARATARACSSSARRGPTSAASWPTSATPTPRSCGARPSGRSGCEDADPHRVLPLAEALAFLPAVALDPPTARRAGFGQAVQAPRPGRRRARPARRRRRADRDRRAPGGRRAQARRRLPLRMRVVPLTDAARRPRRVAVGTFDGVHLGHREVIAGADTVLTFEPAPALGRRAGAPRRGCSRRWSARPSSSASWASRSSWSSPFDARVRGPQRAELRRRRPRRRARRHPRQRGGELPLRPPRAGRHRAAGGRRPLRDARRPAAGGRGRGRQLEPHPRAAARRRGRRTPTGCSARPFTVDGPVAHGDARGRTLGFPTANLVPVDGYVAARARRLRVPGPGRRRDVARRRRERRRAPAVRHGPRRARRGLPHRLRRRPLRAAAAAGVPAPPARRAALRERRRARGADGPRRRRARGPSRADPLLPRYLLAA